MDIRAYFCRKPSATPTAPLKNTAKQANLKRIIDSDSDDDAFVAKKPSKKTPVKSKRILIDSSESEDESSAKKFKSNTSKLQNVKITSKFFKPTTASAMFGEEPIKRSATKLKEIEAKLRTRAKQVQDIPQIPDDDADFEATLAQLDEVGVDGWIPSPKKLKKDKFREKKADEKIETTQKTVNTGGGKKSENNVDLVKAVISKNSSKKSASNVGYSVLNINSDSGFESQMSSDSQNFEENEVSVVESKSLKNEDVKNESARRVSPRKSQKSASTLQDDVKCVPVAKIVIPKLRENKLKSVEVEPEKNIVEPSDEHWLWVEKYKPTNTKKIIGQQGDKSNVRKLTNWLNNWYKNNVGSKKAVFVPNGWNKDPTGACFKAALLSGPPGVGKTTSVNLVCKELGFDTVEFNASDTRSKKLLQEEVSRLLSNTSLTPYFSKRESKEVVTKKHVLVMDEVDGMAGNEDRGGVQELIQLIKTTKIPIICMCNDRNHPKIRSLVNYCFDLRFSRPRVEQIKGYMRSVCFKEKLNISNEDLTDIITSANNDVRLVLNHLSMLAADKSNLEAAKKHIKLSAWDVLRKVFTKEDHKNMSIHDKCDLFFFDYNIAPLFVQENYLTVKPLNVNANDKCKKMELFAHAADCISRGDLVDKNIRQNMAWSLLPTQAVFASYAPGEILEGYCGGQINFPSWLGKNSKRTKIDRLLQEIQIHTRLKLSASKESINLDYASHLRNQIVGPLVREGANGVKSAIEMLNEYQLLKEDLDSLQEICQWPNSENLFSSLDSKVKTAFTRTYNKNPPMRPYSLIAPIKKSASNATEDFGAEDEENDEEERSDDEADAMIITKKKPQSEKKTVTSAPTSSKKATPKNSNANKRARKK